MPGIKDLQSFIDASYGAYLGQDCLIKAAVPATVRLKCQVVSKEPLSEVQLQELKEFIASQINSKQVGDYTLNMDVIAETVMENYTDLSWHRSGRGDGCKKTRTRSLRSIQGQRQWT